MSLLVISKYHIQVLAKYLCCALNNQFIVLLFMCCILLCRMMTGICCTRGAATSPIVIAKFKRLERAVEVANEELKQAHALSDAALERKQVANRKAKRVKAACMIFEEKAKKLTIALVHS